MIEENGVAFGRRCLVHGENTVPGLLQRAAAMICRNLQETGSEREAAEEAARLFVNAAVKEWQRVKVFAGGQKVRWA